MAASTLSKIVPDVGYCVWPEHCQSLCLQSRARVRGGDHLTREKEARPGAKGFRRVRPGRNPAGVTDELGSTVAAAAAADVGGGLNVVRVYVIYRYIPVSYTHLTLPTKA